MNVEITAGDFVYELRIAAYSLETRPSRHDPGDGGEVEFDNIVKVWEKVHYHEVTTYNVFLLNYAAEHGMSLRDAERAIEADAYDQLVENLSDQYDEARASRYERDY